MNGEGKAKKVTEQIHSMLQEKRGIDPVWDDLADMSKDDLLTHLESECSATCQHRAWSAMQRLHSNTITARALKAMPEIFARFTRDCE